MSLVKKCIVKPGTKIDLRAIDPNETFGWKEKDAIKQTEKNLKKIGEYQALMYAEQKHGLLLCLQAMDTGGKDGTVKVIGGAMNPAGVNVTSFKKPTKEELEHDFLWRIGNAVPKKPGLVEIFNRSQYEDVGVVRVHDIVPESVWRPRYGLIREFEKQVSEPTAAIPGGTGIMKFLLHISPDEQLRRLGDRLHDPKKHWKLSEPDFQERHLWNSYMDAYSEAISETSTDNAPWFVIPANNKWMRDLIISQAVVKHLESLKMKYPEPAVDVDTLKARYFDKKGNLKPEYDVAPAPVADKPSGGRHHHPKP